MTSSNHKANLLVELFVEELPPKALKKLGESFANVLADSLKAQGLTQADAAQRRSQMMRNRDGHTARVVMNSDARDLFPGSLVGRSVGKGLQSRLRGGALTRPAESGKSTA